MPLALGDLEVTYRSPGDLTPNPANPRTHPATQKAQLADSIERYGWTVPIIVDEDLMILAGHGRHAVAVDMELDKVPTIQVSGLTAEQKRAYTIADNRLSETSQWDIPQLIQELEFLGAAGYEHEVVGFTDDDMLGLSSMVDDTGFPDMVPTNPTPTEPTGQIESETEPTVLQGDGVPSLANERMDTVDEEVEDAFEATEEVSGEVYLPVTMLGVQKDRVMEALELVMKNEDVTTHRDALFLMAELYIEENSGE